MKTFWYPKAKKQYLFLMENKPAYAQKIIFLIKDIKKNPYEGIGKPEALKYDFKGWWSRRISQEDRLVYRIEKEGVYIASCRYHYGK